MAKRSLSKGKSKSLHRKEMSRRALDAMAGKTANEIAVLIQRANDPFMRTAEWKALRKLAVETYGAKCMCCGHMPPNPKHINVDHIKPRALFPHLAADFDNLQILCGRCNKAKGNSTASTTESRSLRQRRHFTLWIPRCDVRRLPTLWIS